MDNLGSSLLDFGLLRTTTLGQARLLEKRFLKLEFITSLIVLRIMVLFFSPFTIITRISSQCLVLIALFLLTNLNIYRDLKALGVELAGLSYVMPDATPENQIYVVDTSDLIGALLGEGSGSRRGLQKTCHLLQIRTDFLHNAGNDAHVSKSTLFSLLSWLILQLVHSYGSS